MGNERCASAESVHQLFRENRSNMEMSKVPTIVRMIQMRKKPSQWCTCFAHSFNHFWNKSTVRNSMVISLRFSLPASPTATTSLFGADLAFAFDVAFCVVWHGSRI